jgi:hypothetical protein
MPPNNIAEAAIDTTIVFLMKGVIKKSPPRVDDVGTPIGIALGIRVLG